MTADYYSFEDVTSASSIGILLLVIFVIVLLFLIIIPLEVINKAKEWRNKRNDTAR